MQMNDDKVVYDAMCYNIIMHCVINIIMKGVLKWKQAAT
jgi:hypothetical protein